ncbi:sodium-dependent transporter [Halobacteria archaeon AArc-m2/3/4]|uniref:Sodium-dependent transporter n=1 Tax=Natronoglomus mannanivorans TaxID=2979990 RepID=A0ABT2QD34_9EURY|nr:sodium-dependent transporter [Halobacteria archaeon AArc-m2/3/4]
MEQWSSRLSFVFAAIGAAVGLGNIWRFPAIVGQNGGGAYLVPYLIAAFAFAVPLMILEISVGRSLKADVVTACRQVREEFEIVGWLVGASVLAVLSYYLVITGWVLAFFSFSLTGAETSFDSFTGTYQPIGFFVVSTLIVGAIVSLGVKEGIERMATVLVPMTFVVLLAMAGLVATFSGFTDGLRFFFTPDVSRLSDPMIWSAAFGQVFFSFSVGMGVMLTYGSYLDAESNVARSALTIAVADLAVAFLAGIVIFGIVFSFGQEPAAGVELAFSTLPAAFEIMPFGSIVAVCFFGLLFFAAITPSVSMLEVGVAAVMRATDWSRRRASIVTTGIILLAGLPSAVSYSAVELSVLGRPFLDVLDTTVGALGLPLGAIALIVVFTWYQDPATLHEQLGDSIVLPLVKYVVPVVLVTVTVLRYVPGVPVGGWRRLPDLAGASLGQQLAVLTIVAVAVSLAVIAAYRVQTDRGRARDREVT